jgi:hypothetical protein
MSNVSKVALIYDFCLDWQEEVLEKGALYEMYLNIGLSYPEFERLAKANGFFVPSMAELKNVSADSVLEQQTA